MVKRKAELSPKLELEPVGANPIVDSSEPSSKLTDNCEATSSGHVAEEEVLEPGPLWLLLSHVGYALW